MTLAELLAAVTGLLDRAQVPYMVTGSLASTFHGEPRATRDLDVVVDPDRTGLARLVDELVRSGFYVDRDAAFVALVDRSQFNAIGPDGWKVDFMVRRERPFSIEEFARRQPADLLGSPGYVATAEDMIVAKLEWAAATGSERQLRDVEGMLAIVGGGLDRSYLNGWIERLDLRTVWDQVRQPPSEDAEADVP